MYYIVIVDTLIGSWMRYLVVAPPHSCVNFCRFLRLLRSYVNKNFFFTSASPQSVQPWVEKTELLNYFKWLVNFIVLMSAIDTICTKNGYAYRKTLAHT